MPEKMTLLNSTEIKNSQERHEVDSWGNVQLDLLAEFLKNAQNGATVIYSKRLIKDEGDDFIDRTMALAHMKNNYETNKKNVHISIEDFPETEMQPIQE